MKPATLGIVLLFTLSQGAHASEALGTNEEALEIADALVEVIETQGIAGAIASMHDPSHPFSSTRLGINLFQGSLLIADNREPEMVAADYSKTADLSGRVVWDEMNAAGSPTTEFTLKWYHYDTQEVYDYSCISQFAARDSGAVMICR